MTMNCEYDSVIGVIRHTHFITLFCQNHSGSVFAIGKNGSTHLQLPCVEQDRQLGGIPYTAHGAQITPPHYFLYF